jgi:hypothetical protein
MILMRRVGAVMAADVAGFLASKLLSEGGHLLLTSSYSEFGTSATHRRRRPMSVAEGLAEVRQRCQIFSG